MLQTQKSAQKVLSAIGKGLPVVQFHVGDDHEDESSAFANFITVIMSIISEEVESSCIVCSVGVCFAKWLSEFGSHFDIFG